jgi:Leucine-rich repeat (LRR) protein
MRLTLDGAALDDPADLAVLEQLPALVELDMSGVAVRDEALGAIARARRLRKLALGPCHMTATGLQFLKALPLRNLRLHGCSIGEAGAAALKEIATLRALRLTEAGIGDGGLAEIASLPRLVVLELGGNPITDDGLAVLKAAKTIERLSLMHTSISDRGASILGTFEQLRSLSLENTQITDEGIRHLLSLRHLQELDVSSTAVTPNCLPLLEHMSSLKHVYLFETEVCEEDALALQEALPHLSVNGVSPGSAC